MNKKAVNYMLVTAVVIIVILLVIILISKGVFASKTITSVTKHADGCNPQDIPVVIKGNAYTKDNAFFGVIAEPEKITIDEVKASGVALRALTSQDYTWTVKLYDQFTGNLVAQDGGSNKHPGGSTIVEDKFSLAFYVPDNDCNGRVDDFEGLLVYEVITDDNEVKAISQKISFANGRLVR